MHLVVVVLGVLGAWLVLAIPVALLAGRFLRIGDQRAALPDARRPMTRDSFGSHAA